jgi:phytoene dehydrogenase-like protein
MGRLSRIFLSRREFCAVSGAAVASAAVASGCAKIGGDLIESASATTRKEELPVVVVGAGLGGLTAAAYLAKAGFPVTVVEQHHVPGGYATSFERGDGRFYGYDQMMDNSFIKRLENRTPVKGLYLASAWGFPGGGFSGAHTSGRRAFQNFLEDWG